MQPFLLCAVGLGCCETSEHSPVDNSVDKCVFNFGVSCSTYTLHHLAPDVELSLLSHPFDFFPFLFIFWDEEEKPTIMSDGEERVLLSHLSLIMRELYCCLFNISSVGM